MVFQLGKMLIICNLVLLGAAGSVNDVKWSHLKVGQVLKVYDDEDFPADLLCLFCNLADNVCYIKTTNLDGKRHGDTFRS